MKIKLLTGIAGDIRDWGTIETTNALASTSRRSGKELDILPVSQYARRCNFLETQGLDLLWSSLYHIDTNEDSINIPFNVQSVQDFLDQSQRNGRAFGLSKYYCARVT
jgi:hypothetical protein